LRKSKASIFNFSKGVVIIIIYLAYIILIQK